MNLFLGSGIYSLIVETYFNLNLKFPISVNNIQSFQSNSHGYLPCISSACPWPVV